MHSLSQSVDVQEAPICIRRYITVAAVEAETLLGNSARRFDNIKFEAALISTGDWFLRCSPSACWDRGRSALKFPSSLNISLRVWMRIGILGWIHESVWSRTMSTHNELGLDSSEDLLCYLLS